MSASTQALALLDVGPLEMLVITVAAIILFGGDLPDIARRAGQFVGRLRAAANELTRQIEPPPDLARLPDPDDAMHRTPPPPLGRPDAASLASPSPPVSTGAASSLVSPDSRESTVSTRAPPSEDPPPPPL